MANSNLPATYPAMPVGMPLPRYAPAQGRHPKGWVPPLARRNRWGAFLFYALIVTVFWDLNSVMLSALNVNRLFSPVLLVLCIAIPLVHRAGLISRLGRSGQLYLLAWTLYVVIACVVAFRNSPTALYNRYIVAQMTMASALILVAAAIGANYLTLSRPIHKTLWWLFAISLVGVLSIWMTPILDRTILVHRLGTYNVLRAHGFYGNPGDAGFNACLSAVIGFALLPITRFKALVVAGIIAAGGAVILTFTRSAMIAFAAIIFLQIFISPIIRRSTVLVSLILVGGVLGWFINSQLKSNQGLVAAQKERLNVLTDIVEGRFMDHVRDDRMLLAAACLSYWSESPLFGHGMGSCQPMPEQFTGKGPHNSFLMILGESGIVPFGLFVAAVFLFGYDAFRCKVRCVRILALGYFVMVMLYFASSHDAPTNRNHVAMLAICMGMMDASRRWVAAMGPNAPASMMTPPLG